MSFVCFQLKRNRKRTDASQGEANILLQARIANFDLYWSSTDRRIDIGVLLRLTILSKVPTFVRKLYTLPTGFVVTSNWQNPRLRASGSFEISLRVSSISAISKLYRGSLSRRASFRHYASVVEHGRCNKKSETTGIKLFDKNDGVSVPSASRWAKNYSIRTMISTKAAVRDSQFDSANR